MRVIKEDDRVDIEALLQQARKRREHVESAFALYCEQRVPIGLLAWLLGSDPITLLLDWPFREMSLFIGIGSEEERQAAFTSIRRDGHHLAGAGHLARTLERPVQVDARLVVHGFRREALQRLLDRYRVLLTPSTAKYWSHLDIAMICRDARPATTI